MQTCGKKLFVVGISHSSAAPEIIGKCGLRADDCRRFESDFINRGFSEALILSTCNRVELYLVGDAMICDIADIMPLAWRENSFDKLAAKENFEAIEHLFEVASGLQSQMTGETEILGQVKAAYAAAAEAHHCGSVLNVVFQKAAQCAKWIRTNTDIGHGKISIGSVGSELACRIFDDLSQVKILLVGSGEAGKLVAEALRVRGAGRISIASRTRENADALAAKTEGEALDLSDALSRLGEFDITIAASFADEPFITKKMAEDAMEVRMGSPIFLVDLGIPRNIEPQSAEVEDVYLYNLGDLSKIANENLEARKGEIEVARKEIFRRATNLVSKLW